jgi:O-antigen/teichoic acid export membrane protein
VNRNSTAQQPHSPSSYDETVSNAARVGKNTLAQITMSAARMVSRFLIVLVIARLAGRELLGDFTFVITFPGVFVFLMGLGLTASLMREVAKHRDQADKMIGNALTITFLNGLWVVPLLVGITALLGRPPAILIAMALAGIATVLEVMGLQLNAVFGGFERMELSATVTVIQEFTFLVVGAAFLALDLSFVWLFVIYIVSRLVSFGIGTVIYGHTIGTIRLQFDRAYARQMLRVSAPFAVQAALGPIYLRIDVLMLSYFQGSAAVGLYEAATNIFYRFNVFARMFNQPLMPFLAREYLTIGQEVRRYIRAAAKYQTVLGVPLTVIGLTLADRLIPFLYGNQFGDSVLVFQLLSSITILRLLDNTLATSLTATDRQGWLSTITALAAVVNVGLNLVILPRYSFRGAAVTTILTEIFFGGALYLALCQRVPRPFDFKQFVRPFLAGLIMAGVIWITHDAWLPLPLLAGGLAYVTGLLALGTFSASELRILLHATRLHRFLPSPIRRRLLPLPVEGSQGLLQHQEDREPYKVPVKGTVLRND